MEPRILIVLRFIILLVCFGNVFALSEAEFADKLKHNHPFFQEQQLTLQNSNLGQDIANSYQDWNLVSNLKHSDSQNTLVNSLEKTNISGDTIVITNTLIDNYNNIITPYNNNLELEYSIPLAKNSGGVNNRLNLDLAKIDAQITILQNKIDRTSFINSAIKKFYKMKFLQHKVAINNSKLNIEKQQLELLKQKFSNNLVDKSDVLLQENNYQSLQINLANAKQELASITSELQHLIGVKNLTNNATFEVVDIADDLDITDNINLQIFDLKNKKLQRQLQSLNNEQKPQVDLSLGVKKEQTNNQLFGNSTSEDNSISISLNFALPLGNTNNTNLITQKQTQIKILQQQKQTKVIDLKTKNISILQQLKNLKNIIKINKQQIKTAKQKVIEFEKMYKNSNTELSFLISARSSQKTFELNYWTNLLNYKNLTLDYQELVL